MNMENEKIIRRFLFGEMSEEERFDFEERFITDVNLFEEIKVVEDELIEKYVRKWMDPAEHSKFEQNFLTTAKRRERVELSSQLIKKLYEQKESVVIPVKKNKDVLAEDISIWDKVTAFFLTPKIAMAGALTLIIGVMGIWVLYQNFNTENLEIAKNNNQKVEDSPKLIEPKETVPPIELPNDNQNNSVNLSSNLSINNNDIAPKTNSNEKVNKKPPQTPEPKKTKEKIKKAPTPKKPPPIRKTAPNPILALFGGTVRSGGKNKVLNLQVGAKAATLQLNLESVDYKVFQARLTDADGNIIFQRNNLKPRKSKINFTIPAKNLKRGDYIIKLYGKNETGENESFADYQFRVQK